MFLSLAQIGMALGELDLVFLALRTLTALVLVVAAVLSLRLLFFYKGGIMERTWFSLLVGIVFFAASQPIAAVAEVFESDLLRVLASVAAMSGGVLVCWGLYTTLRAWRRLENP
jgi:hypothetical protein